MLVLCAAIGFALAYLSGVQGLSNSTNTTIPSIVSPAASFLSSVASLSSSLISNATSTVAKNDTASLCNAQQISWSLASRAYSSNHPVIATATNTYNYTKTLWATTVYNCTRMCGTICYAGPTTVSSSTTAIYSLDIFPYTAGLPYPSPTPNCTIGFNDCLSLQTNYESAFTAYWYSIPAASRSLTTSPIRPSCSACISTGCNFAHAGMSLYYWPSTANVSRDYCAWDPIGGPVTTPLYNLNSTYTPTTTGPYAIVDGITLFSGNVYLSLMEPLVTDNCGNRITRASPGPNILTIASSDLYSIRKYPHNTIPWSVNYDDLNDPTPWSAYAGGWYCANNRPLCSEVFPHNYYPVFRMPPQITDLDVNWRNCGWSSYGIFDPPIALHSVGNIFHSSSSVSPPPTPTPNDPEPVRTPTPARPGQSGSAGAPVVTPPPNSPNDPSEPQKPQDPPGNSNPNPSNPQHPQDPQDPPGSNGPSPSSPSDPQNPAGTLKPAPGQSPAPNNPGQTHKPNPVIPAPPVITVGPSVIPIDPTGGVVVNPGTTLTPGGPPVVISSTTLNIGNSGLTIIGPGTSTHIPFGNSPVTIPLGPGNDRVTLDPSGTLVVGGTTLRPGAPVVTVDGTRMSVGSSGIVLVDPSGTSSTIALPKGDPSLPQLVTVGSSMFSVTNGAVVVAPGTTLALGNPAVTVSGTTFSIGASGLVVAFLGSSTTVPIPIHTQAVTLGSSVFTMFNGDLILTPGTTLHFGDPAATILGTTFSIGPSGLVVVGPAGTSTISVSLSTQVITLDGHTYTMYDGELVLGPGTTLGPGNPPVTVNGTTFSVGSTGVVVQSRSGATTVPVTGSDGGSETGTGTGSVVESPTGPKEAERTGEGTAVMVRAWWWFGILVTVMTVV